MLLWVVTLQTNFELTKKVITDPEKVITLINPEFWHFYYFWGKKSNDEDKTWKIVSLYSEIITTPQHPEITSINLLTSNASIFDLFEMLLWILVLQLWVYMLTLEFLGYLKDHHYFFLPRDKWCSIFSGCGNINK